MTAIPDIGDIRRQVFAIVARQAKIDVATVQDDSTLGALGLASLDAIEVIFDIEEAFDISFPEQGIDFTTGTVRDLIDAVVPVLGAGGEGARQ